MRYYFNRLLQFRFDIIIPLPATYHFLFGDILFTIRDFLNLELAQPSSKQANVIKISLERFVLIRADLHRLLTLGVELAHNRLATDLLAIHVETHLLAIKGAGNVVPLAISKGIWFHWGAEFHIAAFDARTHPNPPGSTRVANGQQLAPPRILTANNGLPLFGYFGWADPGAKSQSRATRRDRFICHNGTKSRGRWLL